MRAAKECDAGWVVEAVMTLCEDDRQHYRHTVLTKPVYDQTIMVSARPVYAQSHVFLPGDGGKGEEMRREGGSGKWGRVWVGSGGVVGRTGGVVKG